METKNYKSRTEFNNRIKLGHFEQMTEICQKGKYTYYEGKYYTASGAEHDIVVAVWED